MNTDFCTICLSPTNGDLYCSLSCREQDTPHLAGEPEGHHFHPTTADDTFTRARKRSLLLRGPTPSHRSPRSSSSSSQSLQVPQDQAYVLPALRNVGFDGQKHRLAYAPFIQGPSSSSSSSPEEADPELEFFMGLKNPKTLDKREREREHSPTYSPPLHDRTLTHPARHPIQKGFAGF